MQQTESQKAAKAKAAQDFLAVDFIRDGVISLRGTQGLRMVLMASSFNFALKSSEEQDATIMQYENFLNSLDFPIQFVIHSRRLNITPYLETLKEREKEETNELLKIQVGEYIEFVRSFVELTNIVTKTFYVIVPFTPTIAEKAGVASFLPAFFKNKKDAGGTDNGNSFTEHKNQLLQRADAVSAGLRRFGIRSAALNTEELVELFYGLYNPAEAERQKLKE
ncbi:MAG: hypothetical protein HYW90_02315 [Candidatus Sungbacteria bacterium]|nr:hypothetical protein [Candidatus Sungbacteria bacterium]